MIKKRLLLFVPLLLALFFVSCEKPLSDEEVIRALIKEGARSGEAKDIKAVMSFVSEDYSDNHGNNRKALKGLFFYHFMRAEKISVFIEKISIEVVGSKAIANCRVIFVRGKEVESIKDLLPEEMALYKIDMHFSREAGGEDWKVDLALWERGV